MTFLSLFSGIGGLDLGLERAGMRCIGQVEIDPFCRRVLAKHWPDVPKWDDVRTFTRKAFDGTAELICGGFPCQDISVAGKGRQLEGERSGLWWEFHRIVGELRPAWVLAENVPALRNRGADDVLSSLETLGYAAWPLVVGAEHVGAPHKRHRVWIVAYAGCGNDEGEPETEIGQSARSGRPGTRRIDLADPIGGHGGGGLSVAQRETQGRTAAGGASVGELAHAARGGQGIVRPAQGPTAADVDGGSEDLAHAAGRRPQDERELPPPRRECDVAVSSDARRWPARPGEDQYEWEAARLVELPVGGAVDGVPVRLVRAANRNALKAYGNSVVPANAEIIGQLILSASPPVLSPCSPPQPEASK